MVASLRSGRLPFGRLSLVFPAIEAEAFLVAEEDSWPIVIRKDRDDARSRADRRADPVQGVPALEDIERARLHRQRPDGIVLAAQQARDALIIGIGVGPEIAAILELAAGFGRLDQQGGGELGAIEVPVPAPRPPDRR